MAKFTIYITEYNSDGEPEDSYKEWVEVDSDTLSKSEAAREVGCNESDIIQIIKQK